MWWEAQAATMREPLVGGDVFRGELRFPLIGLYTVCLKVRRVAGLLGYEHGEALLEVDGLLQHTKGDIQFRILPTGRIRMASPYIDEQLTARGLSVMRAHFVHGAIHMVIRSPLRDLDLKLYKKSRRITV